NVAREQPQRRARFSGLWTRSGTRDTFSAFRRAAGNGTSLDFINGSSDGIARARDLLQGQNRPRYERERWTVQLSHPDGGGHFDLRQRCRASWQGSETAYRNHARSRGENERNLRSDFQASRAAHSAGNRNRAWYRRSENEQELRQQHRHLRGREGNEEARDEHRH